MNDNSQKNVTMFMQILIVVLGLVGIYYLYQYLFGTSGLTSSTLIGAKQNANISDNSPIIIPSSSLPPLYEGGEFSISLWLYVQNWTYKLGQNKHIISIGGNTLDTIWVYLDATKCQLKTDICTLDPVAKGTMPSGNSNKLTKDSRSSKFTALHANSTLVNNASPSCEIPEMDMQRWVNVVICVSSNTVDMYMDGKLAKSCVLPSVYKVDSGGYSATLLENGGFGGFIATSSMFSYALDPATIYHMYMAGPQPITNFGSYLLSFFAPNPQQSN